MTYGYESTTPERFQQFCQALLISEYPGLQCLPVGQPDGGRDAWHAESKTVLQVKFRRSDDEESAEWMIAALEKELPKIQKLIEGGASNYVMVTNARGTAHPDRGRIDLVRTWLTDHLPCSAICLWRDDLDRRFDNAATSLKFKYPELLTGQDGIELAFTQALGPQRDRQMRAVRAFVATQFKKDSTVKFKQVNLSNSLVDLFIDIPVRYSENLEKQIRRRFRSSGSESIPYQIGRELGPSAEEMYSMSGSFAQYGGYRSKTGAAQFLLGKSAQEHLTRVVLEGAPGQGKSTLAQFVCQLHRATLLDQASFLESVAAYYRQSSFRLPIKIDLRDLAVFVSGCAQPEMASLDEFISELIHRESGGQAFTVDDLVDVVTTTPILLFMDGLDEVADLDQRHALITAVQGALTRYEALDVDLQVVVTSRPSVFGQKANFDESGFVTVDLASIERKLVTEYSKKWVKARALDEAESDDVLSILSDKMELPHIVELTRNPMQLTILLSLIHQIGYSLPDQRTDLYRRYLELFLIREAEKTPSVKKNAALLVSFIQHLAWVLQSQAESAGTRGSISEGELQEMARAYLREVEQPVELADDLFGGGLERIFVLVQRVSGLYEFEVQPLREFFCARHLYETSPVGTYRYQNPRGDRAQRFEALALNPFWLNVTRFYAGSYEPGEIGSLVMSLKEIITSSDMATSLHGRRVAFALLSDWVFANKKSWQDELIAGACDPAGLDLLAQQAYVDGDLFALDEDCGQATLRKLIVEELLRVPQSRHAYMFCTLLSANGGKKLKEEFLAALTGTSGRDRSRLLRLMMLSGAADSIQIGDILELVYTDVPSFAELHTRLSWVVERFSRGIQEHQQAMQKIVEHALAGDFIFGFPAHSLIGAFVDTVCALPMGTLNAAVHRGETTFFDADVTADLEAYREPACNVPVFVRRVAQHAHDPFTHVVQSFPLARIVSDALCDIFGGQPWAACVTALRSAGVPTSEDVRFADRMFDEEVSLVARARYARLKRSSVQWWRDQLEAADGRTDRLVFWGALVMSWTSPTVFEELRYEVERVIDELTSEQAERMDAVLDAIHRATSPRKDRAGYIPRFATSSDRFVFSAIMGFRLSASDVAAEIGRRNSLRLTRWLQERRTVEVLSRTPSQTARASSMVGWLRRVAQAQQADVPLPFRIIDHARELDLGPAAALKIVVSPNEFPREAVARARDVVMSQYSPESLTRVSARQNWSFE